MTTQQRVVQEWVQVQTNGDVQTLTLVVEWLPELGDDVPLYMVLFQDVGPAERLALGAAAPVTPGPTEAHLRALEHELRATQERLSTTIEELGTTNEALSSANEEFQSANEELETSKEELQSVNEALETVNAELRRTVDEIDRANSDLRNLLDSTQIATIFLDTELRITNFTPAMSAILPLRPSDLGRPITDLAPRFADADLVSEAKDVLRTLAWREQSVRTTTDDSRYLMRLGPYRTVANVIDGVVLTVVDVTALTRAEEAAHAAQFYAESIVATVREPLLILDASLHVHTANRAFYAVFQTTPVETEGRLLYALGNGHWDIPALRRRLQEMLQQPQGFEEVEVEQDFPSLGRRPMPLNARPLAGRPPDAALFLLAIEDITARKQAEQILQQVHDTRAQLDQARTAALHHEIAERQRLERAAQRAHHFAVLGRLAAEMSHDIRNPLAAVFLHVDLLEEELHQPRLASPAAAGEALAEIKTQLVRAEDMVQDYLALLRVSNIQPTPQALGAAVAAWAAEWQEQAVARGVTTHPGGPGGPGTGSVSCHDVTPGSAESRAERARRHAPEREVDARRPGHGHPGAGYGEWHAGRAAGADF